MRGEGMIAESIQLLFYLSVKRHLMGKSLEPFNFNLLTPSKRKQQALF